MNKSEATPLICNEWRIFFHPLFLSQLETRIQEVEELKQKYPIEFKNKNATKRLRAIFELAFKKIPENPERPEYRQGNTLGETRKHWFRAKFFQQYRLFFRYHSGQKIIVYSWVNDENTKRAYGSSDDAYHVFRKMLKDGCPPDDWDQLVTEASREHERLQKIIDNAASV